jgi:hypothetical protein
MPSDLVSTPRQRFALARLPDPHLTHLVRLFLIAHHDGLQPTQHEAVWRLPPQGDAEGPQILHLPRSTASSEISYLSTSLSALVAHWGAKVRLASELQQCAGARAGHDDRRLRRTRMGHLRAQLQHSSEFARARNRRALVVTWCAPYVA